MAKSTHTSIFLMMKFYSTKNRDLTVNFETALLSGMAEDGGLFMPEEIPKFSPAEMRDLKQMTFPEVAFAMATKYIENEIPETDLKKICDEAYNYTVPIFQLEDNQLILELFHGPTQAFKDFAARFMARCTSYFLTQNKIERNILVATSGDTGGAIGNGFLGLTGINVFILYPKGGVSHVQEQQLTTMGQNIKAIEIEGTFDDCQQLVKDAFADREFNDKFNLMSANSINVGRVIPQSFYYMWSSLQIAKNQAEKIVYSVPSGNFGNLFGGILAKKMGAPIYRFIAANNANHPFTDYLKTGHFKPIPSVHTLSNAMDIGHPNNYYRIAHLFENKVSKVREIIDACHFSDKATETTMVNVYHDYGYIMCPHTTVAYLGTQKFKKDEYCMVTVSTADPAKFLDSVERILESKVPIPEALQTVLKLEKEAYSMKPSLENLETYLKDSIE